MEKQSISAIKQLLKEGSITDEALAKLRLDKRKGIQTLLKSYDAKLKKQADLLRKFRSMSYYENENRKRGCKYIAGMDEAGRGPLAGPVVAAAVILPEDFVLLGLNDSKQLTPTVRDQFYEIITAKAVSYGIGIVENKEIDRQNIYQATKIAMHQAVDQLHVQPDHILIDAVHLDGLPCTSEAFPKGDQKSVSIAAASILAKVTRDRIMSQIHKEYPVYSFASNMGYGTKEHIAAIKAYGISPYHRLSFAPVGSAAKASNHKN